MDGLPEYMKLIYQALMDIYKEMEEIPEKEGKAHHAEYAKDHVSFDTFNLLFFKITRDA